MATCPECDAEIEVDADDLGDLEIGDPWDCAACGSSLRVANLDPLDFESDEDDEEEDQEPKVGAEEEEVPDVEDDLEEDDDDADKEDWDE